MGKELASQFLEGPMTWVNRAGIGLTLLLLRPMTAVADYRHPGPTKAEIAPGVYLFITPSYGDVGLDGNSIVILTKGGVLVVDSNGTPAAASAVLAEIRAMTDQPVRYLVQSHWHWDHWFGAEVYKKAFPDIRIVAHDRGRDMMRGPALEFNKPFLESQLPDYIKRLENKVAAADAANPQPPDLADLKQRLEADRFFLAQKISAERTFPNLTFTDQMNIYMGERHIQVLHYDRAVTPGDAFVYLPDEKILMTGDLLVNPISFALSCYPTGWLHTLEKLDGLEASIIVPGHGAPLHDKALLRATMKVFRELLRQGKEAKVKGLTVDQARDAILPGLHGSMVAITRDDPAMNEAFKIQLVDWYLHRVYDELNGPLTDDIAPIPES